MKSKRISLIGLLTIMLIVSITLFSVSLGKNVKAELTTLTVTDTLGRYTGAVFTKSNVSTDDTYGDHVTESAPYNMTTALTESPKTMEVVVKLNSTTQITTGSANGKYGTVLGGYITNATKYTFNIEFDANRAPRLYYDGYSGSGCGFDFVTGVPIPANEWTRVTFVRDTTVTTEYPNGRTILYINGEYAAEKDTAGKDFVPLADPLPMIGADNRSNGTTSKKLQGALSYIGLSNEIKSEKEISEQYQRGENLVASTDADCIEVIDFCARTDLKAKYVGYDVPGTRITPYQLDHGYTESPKTFEAMIKLDASTAAEGVRGGTMLGGFQVGGEYHFNFEVYTNKQPRLWWWNASTGDVDNDGIVDGRNGRFDGVTLPDSEWVHLVIVRDTTVTTDYPQGKLLCYVNGELKQTLEKAGDDFPAGTVTPNHWVGRDNRASQTFQGEMQYVTLSSKIKSATEIADAYKAATKVINSGDDGAMEVIEPTSNAYQLDYGYTESPKTFEAMVKLNDLPVNSNNRYGTMIGGYQVGGEHFNFEFFTNRYPRLWWRGNNATKDTDGDGILDHKDAHFSNVTVPSGEWVHLVIVRDTVNNKMHCYVNGLLMQSVDGAGEDFPEGTVTAKHWIGQDNRTTQTFSGQMNYLALSSEIKSASEILDAYKKQKRLIIPTDRDAIDTIDFFEQDKTQEKSFYKATNKITSTPNTFTATIKMPNKYTSERVGIVYGTYLGSGFSKDAINYEFTNKGKLRIIWMPGKTGSTLTGYDNYFSYNFEAGKTYHIAVVRDAVNKYFKLYVDGVWVENCAPLDSTAVEMSSLYAPGLGADLRGSGKPPFLGTLYDVAVYSNCMTDAEVANEYEVTDKKTITKADYSGLLANWVLNTTQQKLFYDKNDTNDVIDYSGNGNNAYICTVRDYFEPETEDWFVAGEDEYTLIYLPDTQTTVHYHSASTEVMFDWITEYAKDMNLAFVMGLGDIQDGGPTQEALNNETKTGNPTYEQWRIMRENYKKLSDAGIAWSAIVGNHDYDSNSPTAANGRSLKKYNYWFNLDTLEETAKKNIVAVYEEGEMSNLIYEFSACGVNYLVIALEFGPSDDHLAWASSIISQPKYANHRILFNSHSILYSNGDFNGDTTYHNPEH